MNDVIYHYDSLIKENCDPVYDSEELKEYMNKWDGTSFIEDMELSKSKTVLEVGVGTGRIALKTAPLCKSFVGIDISPLTIERAKENLSHLHNVSLICEDFFKHDFSLNFDVIYSTLTFMHFKDKSLAVKRIYDLLNKNGLFVLSIDKNPSKFIDYGIRKIKIYPDEANNISANLKQNNFTIEKQYETELANVFVSRK